MQRLLSATAMALVLGAGMATAVEAKTFVYCSEGSPENFSPALSTAGTTFDASAYPVYSRLAEFERGTTKVTPALADSWEISDDGLSYTFHLRQGVKFHTTPFFTPTRDFNADDVLFTFNRQWKDDNPYHAIGATYEYFTGMGMPDILESIEKTDDYTVVFKLKTPLAPFLSNMAMPFASIYSAEYAEQLTKAGTPEKIDLEPIGTGPFVFEEYQQDALIRYQRNDDYFRGPAKIDELIFAITTDPQVRYQKLQAGECHLMPYPAPADIAAMMADPALTVMSQEGLNVGYLAFNTEKKPFDDVRVRQALNMAVNKAAIVDAVFEGQGTVAKNPIPPTMWSYNDAVKDYAYDPEAAKALLAEAGFPDGFETDLWAMPVSRPYNPNARLMAELIQSDWAKVGVKAEIVSYEWAEYLQRSLAGEHQTLLLGWTGDNGDPDNFLNDLLSCAAAKGGANRARFCYEPFNALITEARTVSDQAERTKLYEEAQVVFKEQAPWITVAHSLTHVPMRKEVQGYIVDPLGSYAFYEVDLAE
jgi:dipeptide transport system substrate-binding protein